MSLDLSTLRTTSGATTTTPYSGGGGYQSSSELEALMTDMAERKMRLAEQQAADEAALAKSKQLWAGRESEQGLKAQAQEMMLRGAAADEAGIAKRQEDAINPTRQFAQYQPKQKYRLGSMLIDPALGLDESAYRSMNNLSPLSK